MKKTKVKIDEFVEGETEYVHKEFIYNPLSNYLYYDFTRKPTGNIASLKITTVSSKVNKIGCIFTSPNTTEEEMVNLVNKAVLEGTSVCIGEKQKDSDGYDALINAKYADSKNRLVVQVLYGLGDKKDEELKDGEANDILKILK